MAIIKTILTALTGAIWKMILAALSEKALIKLMILGGNKLTKSTKNTLDDEGWKIIVEELKAKGIGV